MDSTMIERRTRKAAMDILINPSSIEDAIFQHSVLCQTFLPYRNPGNEVRIWKQKQGHVNLAIQARVIICADKRYEEADGGGDVSISEINISHLEN